MGERIPLERHYLDKPCNREGSLERKSGSLEQDPRHPRANSESSLHGLRPRQQRAERDCSRR